MISHNSILSLNKIVITFIGRIFFFACIFIFVLHDANSQPYLSFNRISVNWPQVSLYLMVKCGTDLRFDLTTQNFNIRENGELINDFTIWCPNPNRHCCISAALVIDRSGSMKWGNPSALDQAKAGANAFIDAMDPDGSGCDEAELISFDIQVTADVFMTTDKKLLKRGVDALQASGSSAVWDGAVAGLQEIVNNGTMECRAVLIFTDGEDGFSTNTINDVIALAWANKIRVFTIGVGDGINDSDLLRIADDTGGKYYKKPTPEQLVQIYKEISTILHGFYECEINYNSECMDGTRRYVSLTLQNLSGCSGSDTKTKSYKAPRDLTTFQQLKMSIGTSQFLNSYTAALPILLEQPINTFSGGRFYLAFDTTCCKFLSIDTKSYLLDTVRTGVKDTTNGVLITMLNPMQINRTGVLAMLNFRVADTSAVTPCPVKILNWNLDAGCYVPQISPGEIMINAFFTLITPNGGEILCAGTTATIRWLWSMIQSVDIDLSHDNGKTFYPIAQNVVGNSYQWQIPDTIQTGAYLLRILEHGGNHFDISDSTFYIQSAPKIIKHPSDTIACSSGITRFIARATSFDKPTIQWQSSKDSGATWAAINNFSDTLLLSNIQPWQNNYIYRAVYLNFCGLSSASRGARLTVIPVPKIIQQPIDQSPCENQTAIFHVKSDSLSGSIIQWQVSKDHGINFSNVPNATGEDLILDNVSKSMYGYFYRAALQSKCTTATSQPAKLIVRPNDVMIESQPQTDNICEGDSLVLRTKVIHPISFQWRRNGIDIPAETLSTYKIKSVQKSDEQAVFTVFVNTDCGMILSQPTAIAINKKTEILQHPVSQTVHEDSSVTFSVHATGTNLVYRWMKNDSIVIRDASDSSYTIKNLKKKDEGAYSVMIFNKCDKLVVSNAARLNVIVSSVEDASVPTEPILYQNYPNPFSQETAIGYRLSAVSNVRLEVFDLLGRKIATLIDEQEDAGIHKFVLNPKVLNLELTNGLFVCVMHAGKYTLMKQMVVMK